MSYVCVYIPYAAHAVHAVHAVYAVHAVCAVYVLGSLSLRFLLNNFGNLLRLPMHLCNRLPMHRYFRLPIYLAQKRPPAA